MSAKQIQTLDDNCKTFGITLFGMNDIRQGVVHVIGPEQGFTLPGMTIVCGDSPPRPTARSVHRLRDRHQRSRACVGNAMSCAEASENDGSSCRRPTLAALFRKGHHPAIIGKIGTAGGTGYVIEYTGSAIRALSMEGRMTLCNMSIEGGARAGMVAPDENHIQLHQGRPMAPKGAPVGPGRRSLAEPPHRCRREVRCRRGITCRDDCAAGDVGNQPGMVTGVDGTVPDPQHER